MVLRFLSFAGLLLSAWLLVQKATGSVTYLVGCGAASGCANVLGSRWSQWFLVPVAAGSLLVYAALVFLTFRPRRTALLALATCLAGAAVWFSVLQAFVLRHFCPWCLTAHGIGLACALVIFRNHPVRGMAGRGVVAGLAALAVLIAGQVFGPVPDTHEESRVALAKGSAAEPGNAGPVHGRGSGRRASFPGNKDYNVAGLPHLGDADAPHVVVKYFDYACNSCRDLHADLDAFQLKYPGQLCVIVLPCPIDRACNSHVPDHLKDHPHACGLARLALACWRAEPESFPAVHQALFARPVPDPAQAMAAVEPLLKKPLPAGALEDPWIDEILAADAEDYRRLNVTNSGKMNYLMPKLLVGGDRMLHGVTKSRAVLFQALEQEFKLAP